MSRDSIVCFSDRREWREWLAGHSDTQSEVWFVLPMKESGETGSSCNDAIEEALCFGRIDSTIKHTDPLHRAQRFTPRKPESGYSGAYLERPIWLDERGMLHPNIRSTVIDIINAPYKFPTYIADAIKSDKTAWEN